MYLKKTDELIIPGGESTTISKLLKSVNLFSVLKNRIEEGMPVWGTCAGMILLAKEIDGQPDAHLKVMDITVKRNAYGNQLDSFEKKDIIPDISKNNIPLVFIRAPYIIKVGNGVKVLKTLKSNIVVAR